MMLKKIAVPLYIKLTFLFTLLCLMSTLGIAMLSIWSHEQYHNELSQQLNAGLADYIIDHQKESLLEPGQAVNQKVLKDIAMHVMMINPMVEVYLLDRQGNILGHALHAETVLRNQVSLQPIRKLLNHSNTRLVYGDDPRHLSRQKIFSVAPIYAQDTHQGYLYVVLASKQFDSLSDKLSTSYITKVSLGMMLGISVLGIITALFGFWLLTRPLRHLTQKLHTFCPNAGIKEIATQNNKNPKVALFTDSHNEMQTLELTFDRMIQCITEQMEHIRQTDHLRRELVSNISHDLRTPLASIEGYIETLLIKGDQLPSDQKQQYLNTAIRHARQLGKLVAQLFELSKLDANGVKPQKEPFPILELVYDVVQTYQLKLQSKQIQLNVHHDTVKNMMVTADVGLIERVFQNLLDNAIRYTPEAGLIDITLFEGTDNTLRVSVSDTGKGIPVNEIPYVFERYFHGQHHSDIVELNQRKSTGLGLAIVKRILDLHESHIKVISQLQQGTQFEFALPRH